MKNKDKEILMKEINIEYKEWKDYLLSLYFDEDEEEMKHEDKLERVPCVIKRTELNEVFGSFIIIPYFKDKYGNETRGFGFYCREKSKIIYFDEVDVYAENFVISEAVIRYFIPDIDFVCETF